MSISFSGFTQRFSEGNNLLSSDKSNYYIKLFSRPDNKFTTERFNTFITKLEVKRRESTNDQAFLKHLFVKTHQRILKNYTEYCTFNAVFDNGTYNCLTGTAIYAILLDHFDIDFKIIETNYHIFLIANTSEGDILFESTDPLNGFVSKKDAIEKRIKKYQENILAGNNDGKDKYQYTFNLYNAVSMEQLLGLLYYNYSIDAYNHKEILSSINYLDKAARFYQSQRIEEFSGIILLTVEEGKVDSSEKEICREKINSLRKKMPLLASQNIGH